MIALFYEDISPALQACFLLVYFRKAAATIFEFINEKDWVE